MGDVLYGNVVKNKVNKTKLYLLPLFVLIINQSINTSVFSSRKMITDLSWQEDNSQLLIRGSSYLVALLFFCTNFFENIKILNRRKLFLIFSLFFISSMNWSGYPIKVLINWGHLLGLMLVVLSARVYFLEYRERVFSILSVFFFICIAISLVFVIFYPSIGINQDGRWQGITGNANSLGVISIVSIWTGMARFYKKEGRLWFTILILLISVFVLVGCGSKTSLVVSLFVSIVMSLLISVETASNSKRLFIIFLWSVTGVVGFLLILITLPNLLGFDGIINALGRDGTFSGRTIVWEHAWKLFQVKPIHGWGFDSTLSVVRYTGGRLGQFHNGYLDLLVRGGVVGLSLIIIMILTLIRELYSIRKSGYRSAMIFLSIVGGIIIHNISEASLVRGSHMLWIVFMLVYFNSDDIKRSV